MSSRFAYRFVPVEDEPTARDLEKRIKRGTLSAGRPLLNPDNTGSREGLLKELSEREVPQDIAENNQQFLAGNLYYAWALLNQGGGMDHRHLAEEMMAMLVGLEVDVKRFEIDEEQLIDHFLKTFG